MRILWLSIVVYCLSSALAFGQAQTWGHTVPEFVEDVINRLGGQVVVCPTEESAVFGRGDIIECAHLEAANKKFIKRWRKIVHKGGGPSVDLDAVTEWESDDGVARRFYRSDIVPIAIHFNSRRSLLAISRGDLTYCNSEEWNSAVNGLHDCGDLSAPKSETDLVCPVLVQRGGRLPFFGPLRDSSVDIRVLIEADGTVGRVCVAKTIHKSFNLIFPFVITVRRRLYEPAVFGGQPVAVTIDEQRWVKTGY